MNRHDLDRLNPKEKLQFYKWVHERNWIDQWWSAQMAKASRKKLMAARTQTEYGILEGEIKC